MTGAALRGGEAQVAAAAARIARAGPGTLAAATRRLDAQAAATRRDARRDLVAAERRLAGAEGHLARRARPQVDRLARALDGLDARVRAADPALALARGWSITYAEGGAVVRDPAALEPGAALVTVVAGGRLHSTLDAVEASGPTGSAAGPDGAGGRDGGPGSADG